MKVFKFVLSIALTFLTGVLLLVPGAASADDPLGGNYSIIAKTRVSAVIANGSSSSFYTVTDGDGNAAAAQQIGSAINFPGAVEAVASVGGYTAAGAPDNFYGTLLPKKSGVVGSAYLVAASTAGAYDIYFTLWDKDGNLLKNSGASVKAFKVGTGVRVATPSWGYSYFSLVTDDWNNDGCSDYILTYPTFPGTFNSSGTSIDTLTISSVYVDGQTCCSAAKANNASASVGTTRQLYTNDDISGNAAFNLSVAAGDLDGDGRKEFITYYSTPINYGNLLDIYSVTPQSGSNASFSKIKSDSGQVGYGGSHGILAAAAGDFDGNGMDEIILIFSDGYSDGNMHMSLSKPFVSGKWSDFALYDPIAFLGKGDDNAAMFTALAADLDGDGKDELIWDHPNRSTVPNTGSIAYNLHIHSWPDGFKSGSTDPGIRVDFHHGSINTSDRANRSVAAMPYSDKLYSTAKRLALAYGGSKQFEVIPGDSFKTNGSWRHDGETGPVIMSGNLPTADHVAFAAADLFNESTILGEPTQFTLQSEVKPSAVIQAPPKHWDVISGDMIMDAFSLLTAASSSTHGYEVDFTSSTGSTSISSTTDSSSFSVGEQVSATVTFGNFLVKDTFTAGFNAAQKKMEENTHNEKKSTTVTFTAAAHDDDQLYYTETDYTLWRYPILWPLEVRTGDDGGQRFVQFVVPTQVNSLAIASPGRNVSWYEPLFDTYNLFTYPRDVKQILGYPSSANKPGGSSWASLNGKPLFDFGNIFIGNGDQVTATVTQASDVSDTDKTDVSSTISVTESDTLKFSLAGQGGSGTVGSKQDWAWSSAKIGTTDVSNVSTIALFWPGGSGYKSPGNYTLADQQFRVSGGVYTQDDGTLRTAFAVTELQNRNGSNLWGGTSPYWTAPDPGLLLPWRYTWQGGARVANTAENAKQIRGVGYTDYNSNALPTDTEETITFRVFNYSFINAPAFTYDVYYQKVNSGADQPDITKAEKILSDINVPAIPGRSDNTLQPDNWSDASFQWKTPSDEGNAYLHIVLKPAGAQLSTENDAGHIDIGIYDPSKYGVSSANVKSTNTLNSLEMRMNARAKLETEGGRLFFHSLSITDGRNGELTDVLQNPRPSIPRDRPSAISATVRLEEGDLPDGLGGLPLVKVNLYADGVPVGSKHIPFLASGHSRTITFDYDPAHYSSVNPKKLGMRVYSHLTGFSDDEEDPLSHFVELEFADDKGSGDFELEFVDDKGSDGCDAGLTGGLAILGALGAALLTRKKRG
jgi:hypothetical protein